MRGSPFLRALAAFVIIAALGWPLERLTHRGKAEVAPPRSTAVQAESVTIAFSFTHLPTRVAISHLGKEIWMAEVKEPEIETQFALPWPEEGVDLRVTIDWPESTVLAGAQMRVTDPEGVEHARGIFSRGPADEVLTFE